MDNKILIASIYLKNGKPVFSRNDHSPAGELDDLAKIYNDNGIDKILLFDLSDDDDEHEINLLAMRQFNRLSEIPTCGAGNIKRMEDIRRLMMAGCKQIMLNAARNESLELAKECATRYGKDVILASIHNVDFIFKHQADIETLFHELYIMSGTVLDAVDILSDTPYDIFYDGEDTKEIYDLLNRENARGVCGPFISDPKSDIMKLKNSLSEMGLTIDNFKPALRFSDLKLDSNGLIPCVVQDYKTDEVLMVAYMNEESFDMTIASGKMTYFSRSRQEIWVKGATSGHVQYVKSLTADCDKDALLAKVSQIGVACHTGAYSCFFNDILQKRYDERKPLKILENLYLEILEKKISPEEGSYANFLFDKGLDKILEKIGAEAAELIIASKNSSVDQIKYEISDYIYHLIVLMVEKAITWEDISQELSRK